MNKKYWMLYAGLSIILQGCAPTTSIPQASLNVPPSFLYATTENSHKKMQKSIWWENYSDKNLLSLIEKTVSHNKDLKIAAQRLRQARAQTKIATSALFPSVGVGVQSSRGNTASTVSNTTVGVFKAGFDASYELDIFGENAYLQKSAQAIESSKTIEYDFVKNSLIAELCKEYMENIFFLQKKYILEKRIKSQKEYIVLLEARVKAGLENALNLDFAWSEYKSMMAQIPELQAAQVSSAAKLSILTGEEISRIQEYISSEKTFPEYDHYAIVETPAVIIKNRPDVRLAEQIFASKTQLKLAAETYLYPKINVSALFGMQKTSLLPNMSIWSVGSGIAAPLLSFGKIRSQIDVADAVQVEALLVYEKTVQEAVAEIETNLSNLCSQTQKRVLTEDSHKNIQKYYQLAQARYKNGITSYSEVLQAKQAVLRSQEVLIATHLQEIQHSIALHKSVYQME